MEGADLLTGLSSSNVSNSKKTTNSRKQKFVETKLLSTSGPLTHPYTLPPKCRKKRSLIWKFFEVNEFAADSYICKTCHQAISANLKNTSGCRRHLSIHHPNKFERLKSLEKGKSPLEVDGEKDAPNPNNSDVKSASSDVQIFLKQYLKLNCKSAYKPNSSKKTLLDRRLIQMIVTDLQPFSIVDDVGFVEFVHELDPRYMLPARTTILNFLLPKLYNEAQEKLSQLLHQIKYVAITFDGWTSTATHNYLIVTGHFLHNHCLKSCLLSFIDSLESHSSENLTKALRNDLYSKYPHIAIVCGITDSTPNVKATCDNLNVNHLECYLHAIQHVIKTSLLKMSSTFKEKEVDELNKFLDSDKDGNEADVFEDECSPITIIKKCRRLVQCFHQSTIMASRLKDELNKHGLSFNTLIQSVDTRWNSDYYMMQRINSCIDSIIIVIFRAKMKHDLVLFTADQLEVLPELITLLKPFADVTEQLNKEQYPTISFIIPSTSSILAELESIQLNTARGKEFQEQLISETKRRLVPYEQRSIPAIATILDPRFKDLGFTNYLNYTNAIILITKQLSSNKDSISDSTGDGNTKKEIISQTQFPGIVKHLQIRNSEGPPPLTSKQSTIAEMNVHLNAYLTAPKETNFSVDLVSFWENHDFKELREIALKHVIIPCSSTTSERVGSTAEYTISKRRTELTPEHCAEILFLNKNINLLF